MMTADDQDRCQNHPNRPVTARCLRFNRRFCDLDFEEDFDPRVECLSEGTYCEYRDQCMVWAKIKQRRRREKRKKAPG